ncbi:hypothetical protein Tco_1227667 [Tanacetum coccineum]
MTESPLMDSGLAILVFSPGDDPIAYLNKAMDFLSTIASSRFPSTNNQLRTSSNPRNQAIIQDGRVIVQQTKVLDTYDSDCHDILNAQEVLMANISNYGFDIISEVSHSETNLNDMENQSVLAIQDFEQSPVVDFTDNKITCESKEKEDYMENKIDLEKKIKELDNILFKVGQSAQTVHMLTKPQAFYGNIHKQALGYKNPFHLKKAQRIKPTLYDSIVMSNKHVAMPVIDDEETLILDEESRSKMSEKAKDPEVINKNISHKPIDYEKLNRLTKDFGKRFTPQQELSAKQAFWLRMSDPTSKPFDALPVKIKAPKELPKISLVNESLKKLKFHLAKFDNVVKIRTTPNAHTECEWGFKHTKAVFNNKIIPFLKSLKEIFNVFDRDLLNKIMEVKTVFNQMDVAVQQSSVDKQCLEIAKKELLLENDRLLQQIMSQEVLLTVMNSMSLIGETVNMDEKRNKSCDKCFNLEAELLKSQNAFNDLLKQNEDLKAQIQDKVFVITSFKNNLRTIKGKDIVDIAAQIPSANTIILGMFKLDLEALAPSAKKVAVIPKNKDKKIRFAEPLTSSSNNKQVESSKTSDSNTPVLSSTRLKCSTSKCGSKPTGNKKNDRISRPSSRNMKNKVEAQPRKVNKKKRVAEPICDDNVKHSKLNANSDLNCATLPPKTTTSHSVESQKPELKVYNRKPKSAKNVGSRKKAQIVESKNANHSEPNHTWRSNATDFPSSSSFVMTGCPDLLSVSGLPDVRNTWHGNRSHKAR